MRDWCRSCAIEKTKDGVRVRCHGAPTVRPGSKVGLSFEIADEDAIADGQGGCRQRHVTLGVRGVGSDRSLRASGGETVDRRLPVAAAHRTSDL